MRQLFRRAATMVALFAFLAGGFSASTNAQEIFFGQRHAYSVVFRGNGEAITRARIAFTNTNSEPQNEFLLEMPSAISPTDIAMYQIRLPQECERYNYRDPTRPCLEAREPDYMENHGYYTYGSGNIEYQPITYTESNGQYKLALPHPVEPQKSAAIIIAYAAKGYVTERFGLYNFQFETLKVPARIQEVQVAVSTDSDLLLKGGQSSVDYEVPTSGSGVALDIAETSLSSPEFNRAVGSIGLQGSIVKSGQNLAANESFIVKGEYAASWWRLYLAPILITLLITLVILAGAYFLTRFFKKKRGQAGPASGQKGGSAVATGKTAKGVAEGMAPMVKIASGLFSAAAIIGLTYLVRKLGEAGYFDPSNSGLEAVGVITILLLYLLAIFGPAILVATKYRSWRSLLMVLVAEVLWLAFFCIIYFSFLRPAPGAGLMPPVTYPETSSPTIETQ